MLNMGARRNRDKQLPRRVYRKHGAFYYVDTSNRWHRLGATEPEMLRALAQLLETPDSPRTLAGIFDRYQRQVLPTKAARTQAGQRYDLARLRKVFGHMKPADVRSADAWEYFTRRGSGTQARHEIALLSHCFTWALRWGLATSNPCRGLQLPVRPPRRRYVTDAEFLTVRDLAPAMIGYAMDLALLTGLRQADLLRLTRDNMTPDGLAVATSKTGRQVLIAWSDELRLTIDAVLREAPRVRRPLLCTQAGGAFTASGFATAWQRLMVRAKAAGLAQRFTFHDLRAKSLSDDADLETASRRAGHADARITQRVYRRLPQRVEPLRILDSRPVLLDSQR